MNIAREIFRQLGGNRFSVMTGSKNYTSIGNGLQFSLPKRYNGINKISITLEGDDTYTVRGYYFSVSKLTCDMVQEVSGVYCENLQEVFTSMTGLYTRL
jgi:hypothetical protein